MAIRLPAMLPEQEESWRAIFEIYEALPLGWVLVGGQSVYLHAVERGATTPRPTKDADFALDIRTYPTTSTHSQQRSFSWDSSQRGNR